MHHSNFESTPGTRGWLPGFACILTLVALVPVLWNVAWPNRPGAITYVAMAGVSQLMLFALLCCLPGWICSALSPLRRLAVPLTVVLASAMLCVLAIDARVYQLFGFHLNGFVLGMLWQGGLIEQLGLTWQSWLVLVCVGLLVVGAMWLLARWIRSRAVRWLPNRVGTCLLVFAPLLLASQVMAIWFDANEGGDALSAVQAVPLIQTPTARSFMEKHNIASASGKREDGGMPGSPSKALHYPRHALKCEAGASMNVLVLVVDSLRSDMLTPALMHNTSLFSRTAWVGTRHFSTGNNTMHGMFGLFYGLPAVHVDTMIRHRRGPVLLHELQQRGYQFHLYGGASLQGARLDRAVFVDTQAPLQTAPDTVEQDRRDDDVVARLREDLRAQPAGTPFLGMLLFDSVHAPYAVPPGAEQAFLPQAPAGSHLTVGRNVDPKPLFNRYRNAVLHVDTLIGDILATLDETGLAKNTVVIITSDHGESFNDLRQNDWGHNSNFSDYQVKVPMLIHWPGRAAERETAMTSHMDVVPTLLKHLLGCTNPLQDYSTGLDLFGTLPATRPLLVKSWTSQAVKLGGQTLLLRPYGVESRDADYKVIDGPTALDPMVSSAIIKQIQAVQ